MKESFSPHKEFVYVLSNTFVIFLIGAIPCLISLFLIPFKSYLLYMIIFLLFILLNKLTTSYHLTDDGLYLYKKISSKMIAYEDIINIENEGIAYVSNLKELNETRTKDGKPTINIKYTISGQKEHLIGIETKDAMYVISLKEDEKEEFIEKLNKRMRGE